jgi:hypothetical protein
MIFQKIINQDEKKINKIKVYNFKKDRLYETQDRTKQLSLAVEKIIDEEFKEIQKLDIPERVKSLCYVYKQQLKQKLTEMEL